MTHMTHPNGLQWIPFQRILFQRILFQRIPLALKRKTTKHLEAFNGVRLIRAPLCRRPDRKVHSVAHFLLLQSSFYSSIFNLQSSFYSSVKNFTIYSSPYSSIFALYESTHQARGTSNRSLHRVTPSSLFKSL